MTNQIEIKYDQGKIKINQMFFFPATQARLKKLLKVNSKDWMHREENILLMIKYINERIEQEKNLLIYANRTTLKMLDKNLEILNKEVNKYGKE